MDIKQLRAISFFAGVGGLDLGFSNASFNVIWANDFNKKLEKTYKYNHKSTELVISKVKNLKLDEIPSADVIIGGPLSIDHVKVTFNVASLVLNGCNQLRIIAKISKLNLFRCYSEGFW